MPAPRPPSLSGRPLDPLPALKNSTPQDAKTPFFSIRANLRGFSLSNASTQKKGGSKIGPNKRGAGANARAQIFQFCSAAASRESRLRSSSFYFPKTFPRKRRNHLPVFWGHRVRCSVFVGARRRFPEKSFPKIIFSLSFDAALRNVLRGLTSVSGEIAFSCLGGCRRSSGKSISIFRIKM